MKQFYAIKTYKQYDRDVKLAVRRGLDIEKLLTVVDMLRKDEPLPANLHNHMLSGDYKGYWECHGRRSSRPLCACYMPITYHPEIKKYEKKD